MFQYILIVIFLYTHIFDMYIFIFMFFQYIYIYMYVYIYICMCIYIYMCVCVMHILFPRPMGGYQPKSTLSKPWTITAQGEDDEATSEMLHGFWTIQKSQAGTMFIWMMSTWWFTRRKLPSPRFFLNIRVYPDLGWCTWPPLRDGYWDGKTIGKPE